MSKRRMILTGFLAALAVLVGLTLRDQASVEAFDEQFGAILQRLVEQCGKALAERERLRDLYADVTRSRQELADMPPCRNPVRIQLRARLDHALAALEKFHESNPLDAGADEPLGEFYRELMDIGDCLRQGIAYSETF